MTTLYKILSFVALAMTLLPSFLVFQGVIDPGLSKTLMFIGTIIWFITAPMWLNKSKPGPEED
jgi:hypothetical protein